MRTLRCGVSGGIAADFCDVTGDAGLRFEDARRYCVLFGVLLRETFKFVCDFLVRSAGDWCFSLRALAAEGDLEIDFGVCARGGERDIELFRGTAGGGGADSESSGEWVTVGDKVGKGG